VSEEPVTYNVHYGFSVVKHEPLVTITVVPPDPMEQFWIGAGNAAKGVVVFLLAACACVATAFAVPSIAPLAGIAIGIYAFIAWDHWRVR
jgi:hypothetical protein